MPKKSVPLSEVPDAELLARIEQNIPSLVKSLGGATSLVASFHIYTQLKQHMPSQAPIDALEELGGRVQDASSIVTRITADYMELHRRMMDARKPKSKKGAV